MLFLGVIHNVNYHYPLFIGELSIEIHGETHGAIPSCDEPNKKITFLDAEQFPCLICE